MNFLNKIYRSLSPTGWAGMIFLILFGWFWLFGNKGFYELENLKQQREKLSAAAKEIEKENALLAAELEKLKVSRYQRHLIHRDLGYVGNDEVLIMFR